MYNNSLIFLTSNSVSEVAADGIIPLPIISRRRGRSIESNSNSVILNTAGYYKVSATITFTAASAGNATIELANNGILVPSILGSETITTPDTEVRTITLDGIVRVFCNQGISSLTLVNTGIAITTSNVALNVEYLG